MTKEEKKLETLYRRLEKRGVFEKLKRAHENFHKSIRSK